MGGRELALQAMVNACKDAGISPHDIDGFASYGNDCSEAGRLASALGIMELRSPLPSDQTRSVEELFGNGLLTLKSAGRHARNRSAASWSRCGSG